MRARLDGWVLAMLLGAACAPSGGTPDPSGSGPKPEAAVEPQVEPEPEPEPDDRRLRWSMHAGDHWQERVEEQTYMLGHPTVAVDGHRPMVTTEKIERFEVLGATPVQARLRVTPVALEVHTHRGEEHEVYDEQTPPVALTQGAAAQRLAYVEVPLEVSVTPRGAVEQVHRAEAFDAAVRERFEALARAQAPAERSEARAMLDDDLERLGAGLLGHGLRPVLPAGPVQPGTTWHHPVRLPSMFQATVVYDYEYTVHHLTETMVVVKFVAKGTLEPTPTMERFVGDAELSVKGYFWMDRRRGVLLVHEEIIEGSMELRPTKDEHGTLTVRLVRKRTREGEPRRKRYRKPRTYPEMLLHIGQVPGGPNYPVAPDSILHRWDPLLDGFDEPSGPEHEQSKGEADDPLAGL